MSRKFYEALAEAISKIKNIDERKRTAKLIGSVCSFRNIAFKWSIWYKACKVE